jgi:CRP/FNR family transcriptional regulator
MIQKVEVLRATALFGAATPAELESLADRCTVRRLGAGSLLFSAGEPCAGLFVVARGRTRAFRHGVDGREQIIHEDGPGGTFPEVAVFDDGPYPSSVMAQEDTVLLFIRKGEVKRFCASHPAVALAALRILSGRLRHATGMVERLALHQVARRVAEYLLTELRSARSASSPESPVVRLAHTNQEIADRVGTVREVVSRSFAGLQKRGWLKKDNRVVTILDLEALTRYVSEG